jgi:hypothetical protein
MSLKADEMASSTPTIGEAYEHPREVRVRALTYIARRAQGADDVRVLADHLGLTDLLDEHRRTHAVS